MSKAQESTFDFDEDYEHWPAENCSLISQPAFVIPGYHSNGGLRSHMYRPTEQEEEVKEVKAVKEKKETKEQSLAKSKSQPAAASKPKECQAMLPAYSLYQPNTQMTYSKHGTYPMAATFVNYNPIPLMGALPYPPTAMQPGYAFIYPTTTVTDMPWLGRTKTQVDADNMTIAAREGSNEKRGAPGPPVGISNDQILWVVEVDGSHTLRRFEESKELKGEWKVDPRFGSWYFVREKEEAKPEEKDDGDDVDKEEEAKAAAKDEKGKEKKCTCK